MKSFARYALLIGVTGAVTLAIAFTLFGTDDVVAQNLPATGSAPAPAAGSANAPTAGPATTPPPAPGAGSGATAATPTAGGASGGPAGAAPAQKVAWYEELANHEIEEEGTFWLPKSVNLISDESDTMFYATLGLSAFFFFAIAGAVVYFCWRYRGRPGHRAEPSPAHNDALEITWTVIPTIMVVFLFYYGWRTYIHVVTPPTKAVEVNVLAYQWNWQFTHSNGGTDSDLHVPVNTPVRLVMTSNDVLHAFYAPVMRVKQDIIPRRYTYAWFFATKPGTYRLTCAEYCGTDHSQMGRKPNGGRRAVLVVHKPGDYERYLAEIAPTTGDPLVVGAKVWEKKGCATCHTTDGTAKIGPTWKGSFGKDVPLASGGTVKMDENYIRESIMTPNAKIHQGFPAGQMPSFEGQLRPSEVEGVIEYIKSLK